MYSCVMRYAIRSTNTNVLPEPGTAEQRCLPSVVVIILCCSVVAIYVIVLTSDYVYTNPDKYWVCDK